MTNLMNALEGWTGEGLHNCPWGRVMPKACFHLGESSALLELLKCRCLTHILLEVNLCWMEANSGSEFEMEVNCSSEFEMEVNLKWK